MTKAPERLRAFPAPWCLLEREAVFDGKMPGDHLDVIAFERCLLRRQARQVQRLEASAEDPTPSRCAAWIVAPYTPEWLLTEARVGAIELRAMAPGCFAVHPSRFPVLWIAANELPLHETLVPFLVARSGRKLKEFVGWVLDLRPWIDRLVLSLPEVAKMLPEFNPTITPEEREAVIEGLRIAVAAYPEAAAALVERGTTRGLAPLVRQFTRRLGRDLTDGERHVLAVRLDTLGADRLGDTVLDLSSEALAVWLADPNAR